MNHVNMRLLLGHVPYGQTLPHQVLSTLVWSAQYGVQMFFAVSGFLITSTSLRRWGSPAGVRPREFYLLRFARVEEAFYLFLPVVCLWLGRGRWLILLLIAFVAIGPFARTIFVGQNGDGDCGASAAPTSYDGSSAAVARATKL